ncbi:hypothetical protein CVIRNUC_004645 [Coccomyxa viridis]|uniref:Uncharacterized protein n=1 Tax=Coccomyxa viridis TaxID=1274662 RepID=A0AAV1I551_9CHLO|nr:hypothetical protein CVIRNUC_004645 [Coccomyxa viridis]
MTAVKEYLEFWLTKRTADMKKAHEEQLSTVKDELEASQLEVSNLSRRLVESEDLRVKLEEAPELFQSTNDKVTGSEREARYLKRSREELNTRLTETEAALAAVQRTNPILVAEIKKRHDHANNIVETWRVVKATMEGLQCGEPKPLDVEALNHATPQEDRVMGEGVSTNRQLHNPSEHTDRMSKRDFDQIEVSEYPGPIDLPDDGSVTH